MDFDVQKRACRDPAETIVQAKLVATGAAMAPTIERKKHLRRNSIGSIDPDAEISGRQQRTRAFPADWWFGSELLG